jgi:glycosyltransferase involved in cell wall biosynthesis
VTALPLPAAPSVSVVICTYTALRWTNLVAGVHAVVAQLRPDDELLVVVDHAPEVHARAVAELTGCRVLANSHGRGLSGARNTGVDAAHGEAVAFLDDDALPGPGWLSSLRRGFADPAVTGVAGAVEPDWEGGRAPRWFPSEFGWVVGCDYTGLPGNGAEVRNPIGASMALRRAAIVSVGGFSELVGRVGALPVGCEETELSIRLAQADPGVRMLRDTSGSVAHLVPAERQRLRYFVSRCYHEGRSKAVLAGLVGTQQGLASERSYATRTLPLGVLRHAAAVARGDLAGLVRAAVIVLGLGATAAGYLSVRRTGSGS